MRAKFAPKRSLQEKFLPLIMDRIACGRHNVPLGVPCFHIQPTSRSANGYFPAICNHRAVQAGFQGRISSTSMSLDKRKK